MRQQKILRNQKGFTLVEIIVVLIILGVLASVAVPRYIDLEDSAKQRAIDGASIVSLYQDRLKHEFYLNGKDFQQFPSLRGAVCLILWEENGEVKFELET